MVFVSYTLIYLAGIVYYIAENPFATITKFSVIEMDFGYFGLTIISYYLFNQYVSGEHRGLISGLGASLS